MLDKQHTGQQDRLVHRINVSFDDTDYVIDAPAAHPAAPPQHMVPPPGAQAEEANHSNQDSEVHGPLSPPSQQDRFQQMQQMQQMPQP